MFPLSEVNAMVEHAMNRVVSPRTLAFPARMKGQVAHPHLVASTLYKAMGETPERIAAPKDAANAVLNSPMAFVGSLIRMISFRIDGANDRTFTDSRFVAIVEGRHGLTPEDANSLARAVATEAKLRGYVYDRLTWQLLTKKSMIEMAGPLYGLIAAEAFGNPLAEYANLRASMALPAMDNTIDMRSVSLITFASHSLNNLKWTIVEVAHIPLAGEAP